MKTAAAQVAILYILVLVGYICDKTKLFTRKTADATVDLLLYIITPCILINSFIEMEYSSETVKKFFISFGLMTATHIIAIILSYPFFRKKDSQNLNPMYRYASIYGNVGFIALPLAQAILGAEGVFYCSSGVIVFNIITFTHGMKLIGGELYKFDWKKLVLNPGVISIIIGMPLFLLNVKVPYVLSRPVSLLADLNGPVAMLIFGTFLANTELKTIFRETKIYLVCFLKLLLMPIICIGVYALCGIRGTLLTACAITACVPSGNNTFMFSSKFGKDIGPASKTVSLVNFISIITMPVIIAAAQSIR